MTSANGGRKRAFELREKRTADMDKEILDVSRAAKLLGLSAQGIARLARNGDIPGRKVGREWRFTRAAILSWLSKSDPNADADEVLQNLLKNARVRK